MKAILTFNISDDGKSILAYNGNGELERVIAIKNRDDVKETAWDAVRDAWETENGRFFRSCLGYSDCRPGMCDEHYENEEF